jgi:hypothetical protein
MIPEGDLIDRIAEALPDEVRADYYRELRHCRSLPENDEMLRILRVMQFLTLLMVRVPLQVTSEREKLEQTFASAVATLEETSRSSEAHHNRLEQRLIQLPAALADGINPAAIAGTVNESLYQEFVKSAIPETATALGVVAAQMKKTTAEFVRNASTLADAYKGAAEEARRAIRDIEAASSHAIAETHKGAERLLRVFHDEYRWSLCALSTLGVLMGIGIGLLFQQWLDRPAQQVDRPSVVQPQPPTNHRARP